METRRWGSLAALVMAAICVIPSAGQNNASPRNPQYYAKAASSSPSFTSLSAPTVATPIPTPPEPARSPTDNVQPKHTRTMTCTLTAYTAGYESTGKRPGDPGYGITASGKMARQGQTIAVDPSLIPMGSLVYIEGIGTRRAEDTGGAVKGAHIDVFFNDPQTAIQFGVKKNVKVILLEG